MIAGSDYSSAAIRASSASNACAMSNRASSWSPVGPSGNSRSLRLMKSGIGTEYGSSMVSERSQIQLSTAGHAGRAHLVVEVAECRA